MCVVTKEVQEWLHYLDITAFTGTGRKAMSTLSPPNMHELGVTSTRLAGNKSDQSTRKMA